MARGKKVTSRVCKDHPMAAAVAGCTSCGRPICDACYRFRLNGKPGCARCAFEVTTRPQRRISLAAAFLCLAGGCGFWVVRKYRMWSDQPAFVVLAAMISVAVAILVALSARDKKRPEVENREPTEDEEFGEEVFETSGSPYRAHVRRVILAASPRLSGKATALAVGVSLLGAAVLIPSELKLPRWIEAEIVLALWWLILAITLVVLLYRGFRLKDDWVYFSPWDRQRRREKDKKEEGAVLPKGGGFDKAVDGCNPSGCSGLDGCSGIDGEGIVIVIAIVVVVGGVLGAAWILVELAMPLAFLVMYTVLMKAIGRVAKDRHDCAGRAGASIGWGAFWATAYVVPIVALTWAVHRLH